MGVLDQFRLDGKTALVTGCKRGIGKAMALGLAEAGADIIGVSATLKPGGSEIEQQVTALGRRFSAYTCDFAKRDDLYTFITRAKHDHPQVDILVNNAGTQHRSPAEEFADEDWDRVIEVNLNAPFILAREFGKEMVKRRAGRIIFTASVISFQGGMTIPAYAASKGGIAQLVRALSNDWSKYNIQVTGIAPGYIHTDINEALVNNPERAPAILARIPAGRWGMPDDFKGITVFLASDASRYMNGSIITVDGGWLAR